MPAEEKSWQIPLRTRPPALRSCFPDFMKTRTLPNARSMSGSSSCSVSSRPQAARRHAPGAKSNCWKCATTFIPTSSRRRNVSASRPRLAANSCSRPSTRWKTVSKPVKGTTDAPLDRRLPARALLGDPGAHFHFEDRQRQGAAAQELVVEGTHVELVAQGLFGLGTQHLDPELTDLVRQGLARP